MEKTMTRKEAIERIRQRINGMSWCIDDEDKEALETLITELAESEDEKTAKEIKDFILYKAGHLVDEETEHRFIKYLEKQEVNTDGDFARGYDCGYECCLHSHGAEWLEKQKEQKPNIELIQKSWYMEGYHDREFNREPKWVIKTGEEGPRYEENPKYGQIIEQKPAEWNEEDEKQIRQIEQIVKNWASPKLQKKIHNFLNSLRPQPKQEWSEEDGAKLGALVNYFEGDALDYSTDDIVDWLKSLRPQPQWKPSEEQMAALKYVAYHLMPDENYREEMFSLYEQLKKL